MQASESDHTNALKISSVAVAALVGATFIARQVTKAIIFRKVRLDDGFIFLASVSERPTPCLQRLTNEVICSRLVSHYLYPSNQSPRFFRSLDS